MRGSTRGVARDLESITRPACRRIAIWASYCCIASAFHLWSPIADTPIRPYAHTPTRRFAVTRPRLGRSLALRRS